MEVGGGAIPKRFGQEDRGKRNDHSQLGEGKDETDEEEFGEIEGSFGNLKAPGYELVS
jgi:hypothetical protein